MPVKHKLRPKNKPRERLLPFVKDDFFLLPAISAFLLALSRYPLHLNFLVFFGFIPLLFLLGNKRFATRRKIIKGALTFSTVYTLVALYWIAVVTVPGLIGMFILFGVYFTILFFVIHRIADYFPSLTWLGLITSWLSFEWLQNYGELRFPWFNIGYSLAEYKALVQLAEYGGIYLLSLLILLVNVLLYFFIRSFPAKKSLFSLGCCFLLLVSWIAAGSHRYNTLTYEQKDLNVAIVQVSIPQHIKWDSSFYDSTLALYEKYTMKAAERDPDLILWPESAIPDYVLQSRTVSDFVAANVEKADTDIFLGFPHYEVDQENEERRLLYYNAATAFHTDGTISPPFFKNILVPVGERIPFMDYIPILRKVDFGQANWEYGEELQFYEVIKDETAYIFSPIICFEIAFPNLIRDIAQEEPDFIVNLTNDAWFKKTVGPYQHGMMTVIRAVETRTQFYRAANTGISMVVDPLGNITRRTGLFEQTVVDDVLRVYPYKTFYVERAKNYPFIFLLTTIVLLIMILLSYFSVKKSATSLRSHT